METYKGFIQAWHNNNIVALLQKAVDVKKKCVNAWLTLHKK